MPSAYAAQLRAIVYDARRKTVAECRGRGHPRGWPASRAPKPTVEIVDQIDKEFVPYVKPVRVGIVRPVPEQGQHPTPRLLFLSAQEVRAAAVQRHAVPARAVRQSRHRQARVQHPRLDDRLHLRDRDALLRQERRGRSCRPGPAAARALSRTRLAPAHGRIRRRDDQARRAGKTRPPLRSNGSSSSSPSSGRGARRCPARLGIGRVLV